MMMIKRVRRNACVLALGCLAAGAWAAPISYSADVVSVDLLSNSPFAPTHLGTLDVGTNTVSGWIGVFCLPFPNCINDDDGDAFAVDLPLSLRITALSFAVTDFFELNGSVMGRAYDFDSYAPLAADFSFSSDGLFSLPGLSAAGPGNLVFVAAGRPVDPLPDPLNVGLGYAYAWSIVVAGVPAGQVPEPGTLILLGVALGGLALMRDPIRGKRVAPATLKS